MRRHLIFCCKGELNTFPDTIMFNPSTKKGKQASCSNKVSYEDPGPDSQMVYIRVFHSFQWSYPDLHQLRLWLLRASPFFISTQTCLGIYARDEMLIVDQILTSVFQCEGYNDSGCPALAKVKETGYIFF